MKEAEGKKNDKAYFNEIADKYLRETLAYGAESSRFTMNGHLCK